MVSGGNSCAGVIDAFVSERAMDENGVMRCGGHCTPILSRGCKQFFWGHYKGWYTLNWGSCDVNKCNSYCENPTSNNCSYQASIDGDTVPDLRKCDADYVPSTTTELVYSDFTSTIVLEEEKGSSCTRFSPIANLVFIPMAMYLL